MKSVLIEARESGTTTGRYMDKLIENLAKLDSDINFSVLTKPSRVEYLRSVAPGFKIQSTEYKEFTLGEQLGLMKQVKKINADLVHFTMIQQPILYHGNVVTTVHDLTTARFNNPSKNFFIFKFKQSIYRYVIKKVTNKSISIITPSNFVKNDLINFTKNRSDKYFVTYEGGDKITEKEEPVKYLVNSKFIMYIGRPFPHKNLWRLIEVHKKLREKLPDLKLVLAGKIDTNYQMIKDRVKKENYKNVIFTDYISEGQLKWMYENCQAYAFPSLSEGFGLPGLEAMAHGAAVVSSDATCLPEIYGDAARYFDPKNVEEMAASIEEVISDKELRKSLINKGHAQVTKYSWKKMAEETLKVYEEALK